MTPKNTKAKTTDYDISKCPHCHCMTKTVMQEYGSVICGKCRKRKTKTPEAKKTREKCPKCGHCRAFHGTYGLSYCVGDKCNCDLKKSEW